MPPPPPGMRRVDEVEGDDEPAVEGAEPAEGGEAPDGAGEEPQSEELEALRALEDAVLDPEARPSAQLLQALRRLGYANPLRARMADVLHEAEDSGEGTVEPVGLITDLMSFDVSRVASGFDIPVEMQPLVAKYIRFFQGPGRKYFKRWVDRSARYIPLMQPLLEQHGCPRDTVYLAMIESGFSNRAYSWAHASGPWQFISETGKRYGLRQDFWIDERRDPLKATVAAARFLKELHGQFGHWYLAWAGYNAGGGRIKKAIDRRGTSDFWELSNGRGLPRETQHYVPKLIAAALVSKYPEAFGFTRSEFSPEPLYTYDEVKVPSPTDLALLAEAAGTTVEVLEDLNPALKRSYSPPPDAHGNPYLLRVPRGTAAAFRGNYEKLPQERVAFRSHVVRRGETLGKIALAHGSAPEAVMRLNGLKNARYLKVNTALMVPVATAKEHRAEVMATQVARARREGYVAARAQDEIPAGALQRPRGKPGKSGTVKVETVGGKRRVTYGVASGDSLWTIAQRFAVTAEEIRAWNQLPRGRRGLKVGQQLIIWSGAAAAVAATPARPAPPSAKAKAGQHTLQPGDTLGKVARKYGVTVAQLRKWNRLKDDGVLRAGQSLAVSGP